jgi:hypothetical protein
MISGSKCAKIMKAWVKLGKDIQKSQHHMNWTPVKKIIKASGKFFAEERAALQDVLRRSNKQLGGCDPLTINLGAHRWLREEREEAYSDWLAWVIEQLGCPELVGQVFGIKDNRLSGIRDPPKVARETRIVSEETQQRRTDLDIRFGAQRAVRVEVKLRDASPIDRQQLIDQETHDFHHYIFLVRSGLIEDYEGRFDLRYWKDLCLELRRIMPKLKLRLVQKAMIAAFIGAVEQNILKIPSDLDERLARKVRISSEVRKYIEASLKG